MKELSWTVWIPRCSPSSPHPPPTTKMVKHNNAIPGAHFHKDWKKRVRTWFDQPAKKKARRAARKAKAAAIAPRPVEGLLRPAVQCQTVKYNTRTRSGRGFTLEELREAGIVPKAALSLGIAVDHRRSNKSVESLQVNVARLKAYMSRIVIQPRGKAAKKGDATADDVRNTKQLVGPILPIAQTKQAVAFVDVSSDLTAKKAYRTLRLERTNARLVGVRAKKAKEAAEKKAEDTKDE